MVLHPRSKKHTSTNFYRNVVQELIPDYQKLGTAELSSHIHTVTVTNSILTQTNRLLERPPPTISQSESSLPRHIQRSLAQMRSGYCPIFRDYLYRIGGSNSPKCRLCGVDTESVAHIFTKCQQVKLEREGKHISLATLWSDPGLAVEFLRNIGFLQINA